MTGVAASASGLSQDDILARLLHPMVNEALIILEENKAQRPSDIDVIWSFGYGWPGDTGGPMFYGDMIGADKILATMRGLASDNPAIKPAKTLRNWQLTAAHLSIWIWRAEDRLSSVDKSTLNDEIGGVGIGPFACHYLPSGPSAL